MKSVWITGTSRGLGLELAHHFLAQGWQVYGIGRSHSIENEAYHANYLNLADPQAVLAHRFEIPIGTSEALLIHNAGTLGEIAHLGHYENPQRINEAYQVNLVAAAILSNTFLQTIKHVGCASGIIFISSGAARNAYDGWATYCSSKAGLDMLARCIAAENTDVKTFRIFSIAPGVVDTGMQEEIRKAKPNQFSKIDRFLTLKNENKLEKPAEVASKIYRVWEVRNKIKETCIDLRELQD